jgi:hypothetical protein
MSRASLEFRPRMTAIRPPETPAPLPSYEGPEES